MPKIADGDGVGSESFIGFGSGGVGCVDPILIPAPSIKVVAAATPDVKEADSSSAATPVVPASDSS